MVCTVQREYSLENFTKLLKKSSQIPFFQDVRMFLRFIVISLSGSCYLIIVSSRIIIEGEICIFSIASFYSGLEAVPLKVVIREQVGVTGWADRQTDTDEHTNRQTVRQRQLAYQVDRYYAVSEKCRPSVCLSVCPFPSPGSHNHSGCSRCFSTDFLNDYVGITLRNTRGQGLGRLDIDPRFFISFLFFFFCSFHSGLIDR